METSTGLGSGFECELRWDDMVFRLVLRLGFECESGWDLVFGLGLRLGFESESSTWYLG